MAKTLRSGVVLAGAVFAAGWVFRRAFPRILCPTCSGKSWKRLGGGLKECSGCGTKFFIQLPRPKPGSGPAPSRPN